MCQTVKMEKLSPENSSLIVGWCKDRGEDFLRQWAGVGYSYPLDEKQITDRLSEGAEIFEAHFDGRMVGTIELISRDEQTHSALIGRFVLDPTVTGKGLGSKVLQAFMNHCKENFRISEVSLFVFDFNIGAHKCYLKCGFAETERVERPNGWIAIHMKKSL